MAAHYSHRYLLLDLLVSTAVIGFTLFIIRIALFWFGILPTFGAPITNQIVFEWLLTFLFNSFALFVGRYLQNRVRNGEELPPSVKGIALVMALVLLFQIYNIVFRSWAGLTYNQLVREEQQRAAEKERTSGPFQPY